MNCATKRRLGGRNLIEYDDGARYAVEIAGRGFFNVFIIPDAGFGTFLAEQSGNKGQAGKQTRGRKSRRGRSSDGRAENVEHGDPRRYALTKIPAITGNNSMLLLGVDGVDAETGACWAASGHLSLAIIADRFGIPVKVVADSFQFAEIAWKPEALSSGPWLTTQKNLVGELVRKDVTDVNYRADRLGVDLITELHTEERRLIPSSYEDEEELKAALMETADEVNSLCDELAGLMGGPGQYGRM
jgi:hypothetical protein